MNEKMFKKKILLAIWLFAILFLVGGYYGNALRNQYLRPTGCDVFIEIGAKDTAVRCTVTVKVQGRYGVYLKFNYGSDAVSEQKRIREAIGEPIYKDEAGKRSLNKQSHPIAARVSTTDNLNKELVASIESHPKINILQLTHSTVN